MRDRARSATSRSAARIRAPRGTRARWPAAQPRRAVRVVPRTTVTRSSSCEPDGRREHTESVDLQLDAGAVLQEARVLDSAAVADGAGSEELAGVQRLRAADVCDALLERPTH